MATMMNSTVFGTVVPHKNPTILRPLPCSLEELFCGKVKNYTHEKKIYDSSGKTFTVHKSTLQIYLKPGWKAGTKITFPKEGDVIPNIEPADLEIVIEEEPHPLFMRENNNLILRKNISLLQALVGFSFSVPYLDGSEFAVDVESLTFPLTPKVVQGKGYLSQRDGSAGNLVIFFNILWPKVLTEEQKSILKKGPLSECEYLGLL
uniref:Chaperone DnaJ C-terminal domain-containing protein n=1 Tax=Arcella intermedia TaxID=1963864 RepID=A0A6B2LHE5_9EUKA